MKKKQKVGGICHVAKKNKKSGVSAEISNCRGHPRKHTEIPLVSAKKSKYFFYELGNHGRSGNAPAGDAVAAP